MATLILRPNVAGNECSLPNEVGASCPNHYQNVDEVYSDGFTTYVADLGAAPQAYKQDLYGIPNHTTETGVINKITVYMNVLNSDGDGTRRYYRQAIRIGGTDYDSGEWYADNKGPDFQTYGWEQAQNPNSTSAWTWTDIDNLQIGGGLEKKLDQSPIISQVYVVVGYAPQPVADGDLIGIGIIRKS